MKDENGLHTLWLMTNKAHSLFSQSETFVRLPKRRPAPELLDDELQFGEDFGPSERSSKAESASEQVAVSLAFPGNDFNVRDARAIGRSK